jgi:hypothetical protein
MERQDLGTPLRPCVRACQESGRWESSRKEGFVIQEVPESQGVSAAVRRAAIHTTAELLVCIFLIKLRVSVPTSSSHQMTYDRESAGIAKKRLGLFIMPSPGVISRT